MSNTTGVQSSQSSGVRAPTPPSPFQTLTTSQLSALTLGVSSSLLPSPEELTQVSNALIALGASSSNVSQVALEVVNYCFDNGSSPETVFKGNSSLLQLPLSKVAHAIIQVTTLRQFCRYFAKLIWNYRVSKNLPPDRKSTRLNSSHRI